MTIFNRKNQRSRPSTSKELALPRENLAKDKKKFKFMKPFCCGAGNKLKNKSSSTDFIDSQPDTMRTKGCSKSGVKAYQTLPISPSCGGGQPVIIYVG